jgi:hypothetical protein
LRQATAEGNFKGMADQLSAQSETYLTQVVAGGLYPSKEAALDAAVEALREKNKGIPFIPAEHAEMVEQAIASSEAGRSSLMTSSDWDALRRLAREVADRSAQNG